MSETTFLFGAGADSIYKICEGKAFAAALLKNEFYKERKQLLQDDVGRYELIYCGSIKVFLQTIENFRKEAETVLGKEIVENCVAYYEKNISEETKEQVRNKCKEWHKKIKEYEEGKKDKEAEFFLEKAIIFDAIDEKFNSLRKLPLNTKGKKVINTYVSIFILMLKKLYKIPDDFVWNYENVVNLLLQPYDNVDMEIESYYRILSECNTEYNVITTNYTDIAEKVINKEVVYLHGNLKWFEDYKKLTIYDCTVDSERAKIINNDNVFPFILIPSGVKPLICKKQIEMFSRFNIALEKSNKLCIVGYSFNREDNHINALIAEWLRKNDSELIYFNFDNSCNIFEFSWCDEEIKNKITVVEINSSNAFEKFGEFINTI